MAVTLADYQKKKEYLVCVDSDGCAMDTMDIKHIRCFGPCMVTEWGLEANEKAILDRWNEINLYSMTRGINRFKGLAMALTEINAQYQPIEDLASITDFAQNSPELSNNALKALIEQKPESIGLKKALAWSLAVNQSINALPQEEKLPFAGVKEALAMAHEKADVAIVSSANLDAVLEEWELYGLMEHVDIVLSQNVGSKAYCIQQLLTKGYDKANTLMCGDAPGDLDAALKNDVFYFPILVKKEKESWETFMAEGFERLLEQRYAGAYQEDRKEAFLENLGGK